MMGARAASPTRRLVAVLVAQTATAPASAGRRPHFTVAANSHGGHRLAPIDTRNVRAGARRSWVRIPPGACSYSVVSMVVTRGRRTQRSGNDRAEELHHGSRRSRDAYRLLFPSLSTSMKTE